jgi:thiol-disulfide isomerase/thioredoxin
LRRYIKIGTASYKLQLLFAALLLSFSVYGQSKPLQIGDTLPAAAWQSLSPFGGPQGAGNQYILLDFFASWCTACIRELPKLDSLQAQFGDKLQIILVAQESAEKLNAFRKKNKLFANCHLPTVSGDTILKTLFIHKYLPHEIWINQQGRVDAITEALYVNAANLRHWINGKKLALPLKADAMDFDSKKPLLQGGNGGDETSLIFRSLLAHHLKGMGGSEGHVIENNTARWYYINATVLSLYRKALGFQSNRIILDVADPSRYILPPVQTEDWKDSNLYSYEITAPPQTPKNTLNVFMFHDLNRYLGLNGRMEKRLVKCWALRIQDSSKTNSLKTSSLQAKLTVDETTGNYIFRNRSFSTVVSALNASNSPAPGKPVIIDETGINDNVDMEIPAEALDDWASLHKYLSSVGLELVPVERQLDMFVLSEPGSNTGKQKQ